MDYSERLTDAGALIDKLRAENADLRRQLDATTTRLRSEEALNEDLGWNNAKLEETVTELQKQLAARTPVPFAERLPPEGVVVLVRWLDGEWEQARSWHRWLPTDAENYSHWLPLPKVETEAK